MSISHFFKVVIVLTFCVIASACSLADTKPQTNITLSAGVLRADPGQAQWLEKQSMLNRSVELAGVVSGSSISWQVSPVTQSHAELFKHASIWLQVNPTTLITSGDQSAFAYLRSSSIWKALQQNNIRGIYIAPVFSSGSVWSGSYYVMDDYDDPVSFSFSDIAGSDNEYFNLLQEANRNKAIIGMQILPSATGIGPDFFLAARNMRHYPGIYCIVEVPENMWNKLPDAKSEWDVKAIDPDRVFALATSGLFAPVFTQEAQLHLEGGWAATGEVRGLDGQLRRFAYRYYNNPHRAVLNWSDPSASGRRLVSGSIVRNVGELGVAFVGTSFLPLSGLMPYENPVPGQVAFEPGLGAASDVGREIRRYGGWSWNKDHMPLPMMQAYLNQQVDFVRDSLLSTGAGHALITGNASFLLTSLDHGKELNLDFSRMVHCLPGADGVFYKNGLPESRVAFNELIKHPGVSNILKDGTLQASGTTLAAIALGYGPGQDINNNAKLKIQKGHEILAFFMATQPGLFMVPAHDIMGALPSEWIPKEVYSQPTDSSQSQAGGISLLGERKRILISNRGIVSTPMLYPGLDIQASQDSSFINYIGKLANMRDRTEVGGGKYLGRINTRSKGVVIMLTELPDDKGILLAATNFSQKSISERARLTNIPYKKSLFGAKLVDPFTGRNLGSAGASISVNLAGWGTKAVVIQPKGANPLSIVGLDTEALTQKDKPDTTKDEQEQNLYTWDGAGENWDELIHMEATDRNTEENASSSEQTETSATDGSETGAEERVEETQDLSLVQPKQLESQTNDLSAPLNENLQSANQGVERTVEGTVEAAPSHSPTPEEPIHGEDGYDWEPFSEDSEAVE